MTVGEIATDLFKSPEVQTFYMRAMQTSNGLMPCDQPGLYYHVHALGLVFSMDAAAIVIGGTHSITHALLRAFERYGGEFFVLNEVDKVIVENGVAKGIRLTNGAQIAANIVVSDLSVELTLEKLGKEYVPSVVWDKAQKLKEKPPRLEDTGYERTQLFWGNIALNEAPKYTQNPDTGMVRGSISATLIRIIS
jgi:phytoene dehydrogenase-like protein